MSNRRSMAVAAILLSTVFGGAAAALACDCPPNPPKPPFTPLTEALPPLDRIAGSGGSLFGKAKLDCVDRPASLRVEKSQEGAALAYLMTLVVDPPAKVGGRPFELRGAVFAKENVVSAAAGELVIDLRGNPSNGGATWKFTLGEDGAIRSACIVKHGVLGIGRKEIAADFAPAQVQRFETLHAPLP